MSLCVWLDRQIIHLEVVCHPFQVIAENVIFMMDCCVVISDLHVRGIVLVTPFIVQCVQHQFTMWLAFCDFDVKCIEDVMVNAQSVSW